MKFFHLHHPLPVGTLLLMASDKGLAAVLWEDESSERLRLTRSKADKSHSILAQARHELDEYFVQKRQKFTVPLDPVGTEFQLRVWRALRKIPYGQTRSYGEQAKMIGQPQAARAVGAANGKNPISIIVPCHRVIGADGSLTGFGGGLSTKRKLLELEGISVRN
jgi:methylated-DNA-[protein]-cysteine S-methyltransferase